jgi:hypothetical protein
MSAAARARASVSSSSGGTGKVGVVVGGLRVRFRDGFLVQGPCSLGDLGGWSRGPFRARVTPEIGFGIARAIVRRIA